MYIAAMCTHADDIGEIPHTIKCVLVQLSAMAFNIQLELSVAEVNERQTAVWQFSCVNTSLTFTMHWVTCKRFAVKPFAVRQFNVSALLFTINCNLLLFLFYKEGVNTKTESEEGHWL